MRQVAVVLYNIVHMLHPNKVGELQAGIAQLPCWAGFPAA